MCPSPKDHTHRLYTMMCPNPKDHTPGCIQCVPIQRTTHPAVYNDVSQSKDHTLRLFTTMWSSPKDNRSAGAPRLYTMSQCKGPHKGGTPLLYTMMCPSAKDHTRAGHPGCIQCPIPKHNTPRLYTMMCLSGAPQLYTMMCLSPKDNNAPPPSTHTHTPPRAVYNDVSQSKGPCTQAGGHPG